MTKETCFACKTKIEEKDAIALNKKLLSRKVDNFYCLSCLADFVGVSIEELMDKIEEFKEQGCSLFK